MSIQPDWRTSRRSISNGDCIEVANGILVRDSKDPGGPWLRFSPGAWQRFTAALIPASQPDEYDQEITG